MINVYSGDKSCIVSTLDFVCNLAMKHNLPAIVTFDQPLYWKAAEIITNAPQSSHLKGIVLMLGCFHTLMNLLGAIGTVMEATGLKNILETVYGENAVVHMMTGKAVQRALLGHLLVDKCLSSQLITEMAKDDPEIQTLLEQAEKLYSFRLSGETTLGDADRSTNLSTWPLDCACVGLDVFVFIPHSWANSRLLKGMLSLTISSGVPCREQLLFLCSGS